MQKCASSEQRLAWFGGNTDGAAIYDMFIKLSHTWDDIIDKDPNLTDDAVNEAFKIALIYLPSNRLYQSILPQILPMWVPVIAAYETANKYEKDKDTHGIEIAHSLRYAAGNILTYVLITCVGTEKAKCVLPELWKDIFFERFDDYRKEHLND